MNVLITGGAGFIGSHLAERLLARGDQVTVIDNYATGRRDNLTPHANLQVFEGSIADAKLVERAFAASRPELVMHAAASYKDPEAWVEDVTTNVLGTATVMQEARKAGVRRVIYLQTSLCYGLKPLEQPITLSHPIISTGSSYAISKTAGEQYVMLSGMEWISFRLANAYGPRNLSGPLPTFYQRLKAGKPCFVMDTRRDFIFIDDLIDCLMEAIAGKGQSGPYHISSGRDYSIKELFAEAIKTMGITLDRPVEERPRGADDVYTILIDPSRTNQVFGWQTKTALSDGVARAIKYYDKHGISETFTHLKLSNK